jgi:hypothetical protein
MCCQNLKLGFIIAFDIRNICNLFSSLASLDKKFLHAGISFVGWMSKNSTSSDWERKNSTRGYN